MDWFVLLTVLGREGNCDKWGFEVKNWRIGIVGILGMLRVFKWNILKEFSNCGSLNKFMSSLWVIVRFTIIVIFFFNLDRKLKSFILCSLEVIIYLYVKSWLCKNSKLRNNSNRSFVLLYFIFYSLVNRIIHKCLIFQNSTLVAERSSAFKICNIE